MVAFRRSFQHSTASMYCMAGKILLASLLTFAWHHSVAWAFSYHQAGVTSPFFVDRGMVFFTQADGTLTILDIATGDVLARVTAPGYIHANRFELFGDDVILAMDSSGIFLLNRSDGEVRWSKRTRQSPIRFGDKIIFGDGNGGITGIDVASGKDIWQFHEPHAYNYVLAGEDLFVFRATPFFDGDCLLLCLDPATGDERWRVHSEPGVQWFTVVIGKKGIYAPAGIVGSPTNFVPMGTEMPRPVNGCDRILRWNRDGKPLSPLPAPSDWASWENYAPGSFEIEGVKYFRDQSVVATVGSENPKEIELKTEQVNHLEMSPEDGATPELFLTRLGQHFNNPVFQRNGDWLRFINNPESGSRRMYNRWRVLFSGHDGVHWQGTVGYMSIPRGSPCEVLMTDNEILIGTPVGHVECIDRTTGRSRWLYIFPVRRMDKMTMNWGMPRVYYGMEREYHQNPNDPQFLGTQLDGEPIHPTRVIFDPKPWKSVASLPNMIFAWILSAAGLIGMVTLLWTYHRGNGMTKRAKPIQWRRFPDRPLSESFSDDGGVTWVPCRWLSIGRWRWFHTEKKIEEVPKSPAEVAVVAYMISAFMLYMYMEMWQPPGAGGVALRSVAALILLCGLCYSATLWRRTMKGACCLLMAIGLFGVLLATPLYFQV